MPVDSPQMRALELRLHEWRTRNFPDADASQQFLGVVEEVGELAHSRLKQLQGIRGSSEAHELAIRDAVGDILVYLSGFCAYRGESMFDIFFEVAEHVMKRDWVKYPGNGINQ